MKFLILIFGFGLITFLELRSQYILSLDKPCPYAPTNSALINALEEIKALSLLRPNFWNILMTCFFRVCVFTYPLPRQGIVFSIIFLKVISNKRPSRPIINIVIQITSY